MSSSPPVKELQDSISIALDESISESPMVEDARGDRTLPDSLSNAPHDPSKSVNCLQSGRCFLTASWWDSASKRASMSRRNGEGRIGRT